MCGGELDVRGNASRHASESEGLLNAVVDLFGELERQHGPSRCAGGLSDPAERSERRGELAAVATDGLRASSSSSTLVEAMARLWQLAQPKETREGAVREEGSPPTPHQLTHSHVA